MIQRRVVVQAGVDRLWRALTDPEEAGQWLGGRLEWDAEAGAGLTFVPERGEPRQGQVQEVIPSRYIRFVWWPADGPASEVAYSLEPVVPGSEANDLEPVLPGSEADDPEPVVPGSEADGPSAGGATILTVEEAPVRVPSGSASASASSSPSASASSSPSGLAATWTFADDVLWRAFARRELAGALAR